MVVGGRGSLTFILLAVQGDDLGCERVEFERGWERVGEGGRGRERAGEGGRGWQRWQRWQGGERVEEDWRERGELNLMPPPDFDGVGELAVATHQNLECPNALQNSSRGWKKHLVITKLGH